MYQYVFTNDIAICNSDKLSKIIVYFDYQKVLIARRSILFIVPSHHSF